MSRINRTLLLAMGLGLMMWSACGENPNGTNGQNGGKDPVEKPQPFVAVAPSFNADSAHAFIEKQLAFGPRIPGTKAHAACADWMKSKFEEFGARAIVQEANITGNDGKPLTIKNIIASYKPGTNPRLMVTAHWDSRPMADKDGTNPSAPVPGANDGGSGVGIILEIARQLGMKAPNVGIDLILWDAEDNGNYNDNNSWCLGSQYWAKHPHEAGYNARFGINLDMVGAKDANYTKDAYSLQFARQQTDHVWNIGNQLGYGKYFSGMMVDMASIDDHFFVMDGAGIPMVEVIDRNVSSGEFFPHWHKTTDDLSQIDKETLKATGQTVLEVLYREQ